MRTERLRAWRGSSSERDGRPSGVPLPPARMPLLRGGRPLKRWRWVGAFSEDAMACAARVFVGGVPVTWWAVCTARSCTNACTAARARCGWSPVT